MDYFVTTSRGFNEQEKAEEYAREQSKKTSAKYVVLARDFDQEGRSLATVAVYGEGERLHPAEEG